MREVSESWTSGMFESGRIAESNGCRDIEARAEATARVLEFDGSVRDVCWACSADSKISLRELGILDDDFKGESGRVEDNRCDGKRLDSRAKICDLVEAVLLARGGANMVSASSR